MGGQMITQAVSRKLLCSLAGTAVWLDFHFCFGAGMNQYLILI
jgi:hypothetical protein